MNLILVISICAGLVIYLEADHLKLNPWKWAAITFLLCYASYYLFNFIAGSILYVLGLLNHKSLNAFLGIIAYIIPVFFLRPISKRMKNNCIKTNDQSVQPIKKNTIAGGVLTVAMVLVVLYFLIPFATDQPRQTGKYYDGTITGIYKPEPSSRDSYTKVLVTLDDGTIVKVPDNDLENWQTGKRIIVEEMISMRFRIKTYRFVKYVESTEEILK